MFCKKCGCRIPASGLKCPECGEEYPETEFCNGFWAELNQNTGESNGEAEDSSNKNRDTSLHSLTADNQGTEHKDGNHDNNDDENKTKGYYFKSIKADPETGDDNHDVKDKDPESVHPHKKELTSVPGKPPKKGRIIQIIKSLFILVLLLYSIFLGITLKSRTNRINILEKKLKKAETKLQKTENKDESTEVAGTEEGNGINERKAGSSEAVTSSAEASSQQSEAPNPASEVSSDGTSLYETERPDLSASTTEMRAEEAALEVTEGSPEPLHVY